VTADHETGSLAIEDTNEIQSDPAYPNESGEGRTAEDGPFRVANSDKSFLVDWSTTIHTAEDVRWSRCTSEARGSVIDIRTADRVTNVPRVR